MSSLGKSQKKKRTKGTKRTRTTRKTMTRATRNDHRPAVQALAGAWLRGGKNVWLGCRQIKISVIGRKSGNTISIPVWFVLEGAKLYLLPVQGSDTQWYTNVLYSPWIRIECEAEKPSGTSGLKLSLDRFLLDLTTCEPVRSRSVQAAISAIRNRRRLSLQNCFEERYPVQLSQ
jgi:hypothetical protein